MDAAISLTMDINCKSRVTKYMEQKAVLGVLPHISF